MPTESFYIPDSDDDLKEYAESLPNKSEVLRKLLREHRDGSAARADERIKEIDERLEEIDNEMDALDDERAELKDERARLSEQMKKQDDSSVEANAIELCETLVTTDPDKRLRYAERRQADVPTPVYEAVLDDVDIHYWRAEQGVAEGAHVVDDLDGMGVDTDDIAADDEAASIPDGHDAVDVLEGLTNREREAVREVAADAK